MALIDVDGVAVPEALNVPVGTESVAAEAEAEAVSELEEVAEDAADSVGVAVIAGVPVTLAARVLNEAETDALQEMVIVARVEG